MDTIINLQKKIVPELTDLLVTRYQILLQVSHEHPIGRRALSVKVGLSERILRAQVDFLKKSGLLEFSPAGMTVTDEGMGILAELADYVRKLQGISFLEKALSEALGIKQVVIITGDCDEDEVVKQEIGRTCAKILSKLLADGEKHIVAVSGGTTMAAMAANVFGTKPNTVVVPARGGLGDNVDLQANTIATVLAQRLGATYRQLYVPDSVSSDIMNSILKEDVGVRAVVDIIKRADILVHGMGLASVMAKHRRMSEELVDKLMADGAVGEAFGQYCAIDGRPVYLTNNAGLMLQDLDNIHTIIGMAGGKSKAEAILSITRASRQDILVTDEAAANEIMRLVEEHV
ncbi:MAG: sugar-binding domain-containing protein [Phascolarctobacterium sp.]|nr:sugar-binding domain-containing protein [Phascolarctobacterium sp.]